MTVIGAPYPNTEQDHSAVFQSNSWTAPAASDGRAIARRCRREGGGEEAMRDLRADSVDLAHSGGLDVALSLAWRIERDISG
jgi:hypothetical protein